MLHNPDVQEKAQAELDKVIGFDRMPEYEDKDNLPYINAIINEALRWRPVAVLGGQPHAVIEDDVYNGMFIPKGSTVFANFYGIMQDPEMFPDPATFRPERFLETTNPRLKNFDLPFGFGRRSCPGIHLARNSLFINVARLLWGFRINPATDEKGKEIMPDCNAYTNGFNSRPVAFPCRFTPRSPKVTSCIETEWQAIQPRLEVTT
jgi:cytochrome P450